MTAAQGTPYRHTPVAMPLRSLGFAGVAGAGSAVAIVSSATIAPPDDVIPMRLALRSTL